MNRVYQLVADLALARGISNLAKITEPGKAFEITFGDPDSYYTVACNPHRFRCTHRDVDIDPFHMFIWWNDWPHASIGPDGGAVAVPGGEHWHAEDVLIVALEEAIHAAKHSGGIPAGGHE